MKRKIGFIFLVFLSLFFLFSCGDKNNQIEFTEEYFEKKLVILKKEKYIRLILKNYLQINLILR